MLQRTLHLKKPTTSLHINRQMQKTAVYLLQRNLAEVRQEDSSLSFNSYEIKHSRLQFSALIICECKSQFQA